MAFPCTIPANSHVPLSSTWSVCDSSERPGLKQQEDGNFLPGKQHPGKFLRLRFFQRLPLGVKGPLTCIACQGGHAFSIPRFLVTGRVDPSRDCKKGKEGVTIQLCPSSTELLLPQQLSPHEPFPFYFPPLLPWSKHFQSHLPLWKGYGIQIHLGNDFSKRCLCIQC